MDVLGELHAVAAKLPPCGGRPSCECCGQGKLWGHIDYKFVRSGDISYGPFGREVY
jgi:hypothetical protein